MRTWEYSIPSRKDSMNMADNISTPLQLLYSKYDVPFIREDFSGFLAESEELTRTVVFFKPRL